jgi:hypothetical protein
MEKFGVPLVRVLPGQVLVKEPYAVGLEVVNTCAESYGMAPTFFFGSGGEFLSVGTWE